MRRNAIQKFCVILGGQSTGSSDSAPHERRDAAKVQIGGEALDRKGTDQTGSKTTVQWEVTDRVEPASGQTDGDDVVDKQRENP